MVLEKVNGCVYLLNILHNETQRNTTKPKELILTPFSLFEIKCKKLNAKNLWRCIFGPSRKVSFSYFPMFPLDHRGSPPLDTLQNFRGPWYDIQFKPYTTSKMELFVKNNR